MKQHELKALVLATLMAPILNDRSITGGNLDVGDMVITYLKAANIIISTAQIHQTYTQPQNDMD